MMKKVNFNRIAGDPQILNAKRIFFIGDITLSDVSESLDVRGQKIYYAGFKKGARTKMHFHEGDQILATTRGTGQIVLYDRIKTCGRLVKIKQKSRIILRAGDVVFIPRRTLHWHGALEGKNFGHVAFNGFSHKGKEARTIWYDSDFSTRAIKIS